MVIAGSANAVRVCRSPRPFGEIVPGDTPHPARVSAFQMGFVSGASACAVIDEREVKQRRGDLPIALTYDQSGRLEAG